jgi:hypothetical protein
VSLDSPFFYVFAPQGTRFDLSMLSVLDIFTICRDNNPQHQNRSEVVMGSFVSTHAKSYKQNQVGKLQAHEERTQLYDVNVFPELTHNNRQHVFAEYGALEERMIEAKREAGVRPSNLKFRKDANVIFSNVVALSREQVDQVKADFPDTWREKIMDSARAFSVSVQERFGFEPLSINLHLDEGHIRDEVFCPNVHMHINFFNFDFKNLAQPQRTMHRRHFSELQDMAGKAFAMLGFERGRRDYLGNRKHLEKGEYLYKILAELETENAKIKAQIIDYRHKMFESKEEVKTTQEYLRELDTQCFFARERLDDIVSRGELMVAELDAFEIEMDGKKKEIINNKNNEIKKDLSHARAQAALEVEKISAEKGKVIDSFDYRIAHAQKMLRSVSQSRSRIDLEVSELESRYMATKNAQNPREMILERQNGDLRKKVQMYQEQFGDLSVDGDVSDFNFNAQNHFKR